MRMNIFSRLKVILSYGLLLAMVGASLTGQATAQTAPPQPPPPAEPGPIQKGVPPIGIPTNFPIIEGEYHQFQVELKAGEAFPVTLKRNGFLADLFVTDLKDNTLATATMVADPQETVQLVFIPKEAGSYRLYVDSKGQPDGEKQYSLTIEPQRPPTATDLAINQLNIAIALQDAQKFPEADTAFTRATEMLKAVNRDDLRALGLYVQGFVRLNLNQAERARAVMEESLNYYRSQGNENGVRQNLGNLVAACKIMADYQRAVEYGLEALEPYRKDKKLTLDVAFTLNGIGSTYQDLGNYPKSLEYQTEALDAFVTLKDEFRAARTKLNLATVHRLTGNYPVAFRLAEEARAEFKRLNASDYEIQAVGILGAIATSSGDFDRAAGYYLEALPVVKAKGMSKETSELLHNLGVTYRRMGKPALAIPLIKEALGVLRSTDRRTSESAFLASLARAEFENDMPEEALGHAEEAVNLAERILDSLRDTGNRLTFSAQEQETYQLYQVILMEFHRRHPDRGYSLMALQVAERARARLLVEQLLSRKTNLREGVNPELLARQREARRVLDARSQALGRAAADPARTEALKKEVDAALEAYQVATRRLDEASPRFARAARPKPLSLPEVQGLLDPETVLIEFSLLAPRSCLWLVTDKGLKTVELSSRETITQLAREAYETLTARSGTARFESPAQRKARIAEADRKFVERSRDLSRLLFGEIAPEIAGKRLIVVPDGPLSYLPFGALPFPGSGEPLIARCEVTQLPSIATLAAIRTEAEGRKANPRTVAVLADPVFDAADPRVNGATVADKPAGSRTPDVRRSVAEVDGPNRGWPPVRLPATRREAQAIAKLVPTGQRLAALDFSAGRATVLENDLSQFRFLHFATHGLLNDQNPELSGLVLSLVDEKGQPTDGFLHGYEVFNLKLPVELVVLSGCRTGLGKEIRGEGMIGLTRAFMYAGASRVMVSLWSVSDESTSVLMADVYRGMLGPKKLRPSAALREAQLKMMKNPRWSSPFYWAAFTIQGEPR